MASTRRKASGSTQRIQESTPAPKAKKGAKPRARKATAQSTEAPAAVATSEVAAAVATGEVAAAAPAAELVEALAAETTLRFGGDWSQSVAGTLVAGGRLKLEYDPARAQQREVRDGVPAWGVQAYVMFVPGGELLEAPAIEFGRNGESTQPRTRAFSVEIPANAHEVQVWFKNWSAGGQVETWDSNFGHNYRFQIWR